MSEGPFSHDVANVELHDVICIIKRAIYKREQRREKIGLRTYANSKASGKPAHPRSLARSFAVCLKFYQGLLLEMQTGKLLVKLHRRAGLPEALLFAYVRRPIFSRCGSFIIVTCMDSYDEIAHL